jgi:hypothetical protein
MASLFILLMLLKPWAFEAGKEGKGVARQPHGKSENFLFFRTGLDAIQKVYVRQKGQSSSRKLIR